MKKTVLLLAVCLMLGLCACGLRGQSVARNTVEPVHFSAPAVRQDAAPAEEPRVTLPQGASLLTEQELRWFGGSCFNVLPSRGPNLFLAASYDRAEDMDLASLFAAGAGSRELSDRELRQLGMDGCARLTAVELEDLLLRCTGLGLADMSDSAFHGLVYLADFDAYYAPAGDAGYVRFLPQPRRHRDPALSWWQRDPAAGRGPLGDSFQHPGLTGRREHPSDTPFYSFLSSLAKRRSHSPGAAFWHIII